MPAKKVDGKGKEDTRRSVPVPIDSDSEQSQVNSVDISLVPNGCKDSGDRMDVEEKFVDFCRKTVIYNRGDLNYKKKEETQHRTVRVCC